MVVRPKNEYMINIQTVKKRDGSIVSFDPAKIAIAIEKAFVAVAGASNEVTVKEIARSAISEMDLVYAGKVPSVEDVQDAVERSLMKKGFYAVAKSYILYRYEHTKVREKKEHVEEIIEKNALHVTKSDGTREPFNEEKLRRTIARAAQGYENVVDVENLLAQCKSELYDGMETKEIAKSVSMSARAMIEVDPAYSKVAARVMLGSIYGEVLGKVDYRRLKELHVETFEKNIKFGVQIDRLDVRLLEFDLGKLAQQFNLENDELFDYMGLEVLYSRYLLRDPETNKILETPQMFWMRVAMGTALNEDAKDRDQVVKDFYHVLAEFLYTPGGRTMFHAGTPKPQLSSCFLNTVPDSLDLIFKTYADNAQLLKWSGGTGTDWTSVRGTGSLIKGTGVGSQGVIPFLKIANDVTVSINRSGKRRGAACVYLESWHYDVIDFLELRKNTGDERRRTHDINTANWIPDLLMKRIKQGGQWTLFSPDETSDLHDLMGSKFEKRYEEYEKMADEGKIRLWKRMPAKDLWRRMLAMLFETGHPWITFKDASNVRSPQDHVGVVHNSNLCTEITLNTSKDETAVCNLGSVNFAKFITNGAFDEEKVAKVVKIAMRMLDNVIDINYYPTEDAKRSNMKHRPLGLGIRGFQDALYMLGINFDSEACVQFADESMEIVAYYAYLGSSELAKERGTYETYKGSKWDRDIFPQDTLDLLERERGVAIPIPRAGKKDWTPVREHVKKYGMRNSNCLANAPTASTANLVGCVPTIEPIYKNLYVKSNKEGNFIVVNKYLVEELKNRGLWTPEIQGKIKYFDGSIQSINEIPQEIKDKYKEVFEIDTKWLVKSAAYRGKWIDQSQSLNIFFHGTSGKALSEVYFYAWEMGLKTTYYLRTLGASQVEKSTVDISKYGATHTRGVAQQASSQKAVTTNQVAPASVGAVAVSQQTPQTFATQQVAPTPLPSAQMPKNSQPQLISQRPSNVIVTDDAICDGCEG